jgi:dTDP-4-dehydrorhamnose reductase
MIMDRGDILITGGGGMLAHAFLRRRSDILPSHSFAISQPRSFLDISDEQQARHVFEEIRPTIVLNCAAYTKVDLAEQEEEKANRVNGHAVGTLARLCREFGSMLVHFSTDYVFDGSLHRPLRPDDPVGPQSAYGRSKLLGEQLLQQNAPDRWLIIRTAWLYGSDGPSFPRAILNAARAGKPLTVIDDQVGSPTFTDDLAQATVDLIERKAANGIWHIVNDGQTNWHDFAAVILQTFDLNVPLARTTSAEWKATRPNSAVRPAYSVLDIAPFEQLTRRRTRPWQEALHDFAKLDAAG